MKIEFRFTINIKSGKKEETKEEHHRQGDVYATTEMAWDHRVPELHIGFSRDDPWGGEDKARTGL